MNTLNGVHYVYPLIIPVAFRKVVTIDVKVRYMRHKNKVIRYISPGKFIGDSFYCFLVDLLLSVRRCTMYSVRCTLYTVHCTLYNVQCTLYTIHRITK